MQNNTQSWRLSDYLLFLMAFTGNDAISTFYSTIDAQ